MTDSDTIYVENLTLSKILRARTKPWFRYHNNVQHPAREDHSDFIGILGIIEEKAGRNLFDGGSRREDWKTLLSVIDTMSLDELKDVENKISRFKSEKLFRKPR